MSEVRTHACDRACVGVDHHTLSISVAGACVFLGMMLLGCLEVATVVQSAFNEGFGDLPMAEKVCMGRLFISISLLIVFLVNACAFVRLGVTVRCPFWMCVFGEG